jgi:hypothetical protein
MDPSPRTSLPKLSGLLIPLAGNVVERVSFP